jgi:hypothetical protein
VAPVVTAQPALPKCTNRTTEDEALQFHASGPLIKMAKIDADRVKAAAVGLWTSRSAHLLPAAILADL